MALLKIIFYVYNYPGDATTLGEFVSISCWSLVNDLVILSICLLPFFVAANLPLKTLRKVGMYFSLLLLIFMLMLNAIDIFYFPFHRQRADADILYVLRNPANYGGKVWLIIVFGSIVVIFLSWYLHRQFKRLHILFKGSPPHIILLLMILSLVFFVIGGTNALLPSRPLTSLPADKLPLVQNSLHTFLYSTYRGGNSYLFSNSFIDYTERSALFSNQKQNSIVAESPRNVVLFIMESVPFEFFDVTHPHKPALPFFDSIITHSTLYKNAFSYSYSSNKGITAILSGIPTITDIPLYHSGFVNIDRTSVGSRLEKNNYQSGFFIGDNYDDFGFAKCANWLGIQNYYSMEDIPDYKKMEKHSMGLHDEYVLNFMQQKLKNMQQPFFVTQYNISTHYPNDLPKDFAKKVAKLPMSPAQKTMLYYDWCMQHFFSEAKNQTWYNNTVFVFCSDHWAAPLDPAAPPDVVNSFRIPVIIFDPSSNQGKMVSRNVSQLDIVNTILAYAGDGDSMLSYGESLIDPARTHRTVFTKTNNSVYQAINDSIVFGFDAEQATAVYAYDYKKDSFRKNNLVTKDAMRISAIEREMRAFLQTAVIHYKGKAKK